MFAKNVKRPSALPQLFKPTGRPRGHTTCRSAPTKPETASYFPNPSAIAIARNTRVLSIRPRNCSAPGPIAVSTTSSAA